MTEDSMVKTEINRQTEKKVSRKRKKDVQKKILIGPPCKAI